MPHIVLSDCKYQHMVHNTVKHISKETNNMDHKKAFQPHFIEFTKKIQGYTQGNMIAAFKL